MDSTATAASMPSATLTAHVIFGSTPKLTWFNSGDGTAKANPDLGCTVRGICNVQSLVQGSFSSQMNGKSIEVEFGVVPTGYPLPGFQNYLTMSFKLADLQVNQPAQAQYFGELSGAYSFDTEFDLGSDVFAGLKLPVNSAVLTSGTATYSNVNGSINIMCGLYTRVTGYAVFGEMSNEVCEQYIDGFCSVSADAAQVGGVTPTKIDFMVVTNDLIMASFNYAELKLNQPITAATTSFSDPVAGNGSSNYPLQNDFLLDNPLFLPLGLVPGAKLSSTGSGGNQPIYYNKNNNQFTLTFNIAYGAQQPPN